MYSRHARHSFEPGGGIARSLRRFHLFYTFLHFFTLFTEKGQRFRPGTRNFGTFLHFLHFLEKKPACCPSALERSFCSGFGLACSGFALAPVPFSFFFYFLTLFSFPFLFSSLSSFDDGRRRRPRPNPPDLPWLASAPPACPKLCPTVSRKCGNGPNGGLFSWARTAKDLTFEAEESQKCSK